jgi:hypothetical protein
MNRVAKIVTAFVFVDFLALNVYLIATFGYLGAYAEILKVATENLGATLIAVDLCIALGMAMVWMWNDAKAHGRNVWGYLLLTLALGSLGPLLYLLLTPAPAPARAA